MARSRVMIEDYKGGQTWVITQTQYSDDDETCSITVGVPEMPLMPRYIDYGMPELPEQVTEPASPVVRSVTDEMLRNMGVTRAQWAKMTPKQRRALKKAHGY